MAADTQVRVVALTQDRLQRKDPQQWLDDTFTRLEGATEFRPDIVCLPENCPGREPEEVPGPTVERFAQWARQHRCWTICPLTERSGGRLYNSAILLDRAGERAGGYRKIHLTEGEMQRGIVPADLNPPLFETDFGAIGIQICFDVNWWEAWVALKRKGARIVFWPSAYPAARQLSALAWKNEFYIVSATRTGGSRIYDITGEELDHSGNFKPWAQCTLNLGKRLFEIDYHVEKAHEIARVYGDRVEVKWYGEEDWFTLACNDPELSVDELITTYALTPKQLYHARCDARQAEVRGGVSQG